jgi:hypothetical protein
MATIVVDIDNTLNTNKLIPSLYIFKGVKRVCLEQNLIK